MKDNISIPGVLTIGDNLRIFSLGNNFYIVSTKGAITQDIINQMGGMTMPPGAAMWFIGVDDDNLGEFTPLEKSKELKELIVKIVEELVK